MADIKTPEERSRNMAAIKGKDTGPEIYLRKLLFSEGYRYRKYPVYIPGHPDLWLKKYNTAIFVNGFFWHRHQGCRYAYIPKTRHEFWNTKFEQNVKRDQTVRIELQKKGIRCLIIWECTLRNARKKGGAPDDMLRQIQQFLQSDTSNHEI